jgi:multisubunit Na+/H+ antiporter MnhB subunit
METESQRSGLSFQGWLTLAAGLAIVAVMLIWVPATRWFAVISVPIGAIFAGIFYLWHKFKPVKPEDVDKRPLKLT